MTPMVRDATTTVNDRRSRCGLKEQTRRRPSVHVRRLRPTDGAALLGMHERCSLATRYSRWLTSNPAFPTLYLRSLLACTTEHIAVVAVCDRQPEEVIGLASAALGSDGWRELGFLVEDRFQTCGIGTLMLDSLMDLLDRNGHLCALALFQNRWMVSKLARVGTVTTQHDGSIIHMRIYNREAMSDGV